MMWNRCGIKTWAVLTAVLILGGAYFIISHAEIRAATLELIWESSETHGAKNTEISNTGGSTGVPQAQRDVTTYSDDVKKVVLLTYMRSGSSFVGELFNQYPGAFYHFEPMRGIIHSVTGGNHGHEERHNTNSLLLRKLDDPEKKTYVSAINNMLTCRHDLLPAEFFSNEFMTMYRYPSNSDYVDCIRRKNASTDHTKCIPLMQGICRTAPIRAIKTVRLWMDLMGPLLSLDPGLKIVHLIRDPRAITLSRMNLLEKVPPHAFTQFAGSVCEIILKEVRERQELEVQYPKSFYQLRYEDVASNTGGSVESLYDFIGLSVPDHLKKWVYDHTHAESPLANMNPGGLSRTNSSISINTWRTSLNSQVQKDISAHPQCIELFKYANYPLD